MASRTLASNTNDSNHSNQKVDLLGNEDDDTEMAGANRVKIDAVEHEKNVKWQLPGNHDAASAKKIMIQLMSNRILNSI